MSTSSSSSAVEPQRQRILVVDDDAISAESLADFLHAEGFDAECAWNGDEALERLAAAQRSARPFAAAFCDVSMPVLPGLEFLKKAAKAFPSLAVVMLTGYGTIETAAEAIKLGAVEFLTKPMVDAELRLALQRAIRHHTLIAENCALKGQLEQKFSLGGEDGKGGGVVGHDPRMVKIFDLVQAVAPSKTTVLMTGESGTGKSLIAHAIHLASPRASKPFVQLSCGSIPETLLESELFGHVKGAFTGAHADKAGRFLTADGGTIFLDEINSASAAMQLKLLRVLQERKFEPVGATSTIEVDVRVILATNRPLEDLVKAGEFRQDLYYRINVVQIELPALRERISDIPLLAEHFLKKHAASLGRTITGLSPEALDALRRYTYPGNVRELENIIERAAVLSRSPTIALGELPPQVVENSGNHMLPAHVREKLGITGDAPTTTCSPASVTGGIDDGAYQPLKLEDALKDPEKRIILRALAANAWNRQKTADDLGINRTTLYKKMRALGIDGADDASAERRIAG